MSNALSIHEAESLLNEMRLMEDRIRQRSSEIYPWNGRFDRDLDNWLNAEKELIWKPSIELREKNNQYVVDVALPGVDPKDVYVEVTQEEILQDFPDL